MSRWAWRLLAALLWLVCGFPAFLICLPVRLFRPGGWLALLALWVQTPYAIARRKGQGWLKVGDVHVLGRRRGGRR